jgi:uncharacterized membrane protein YbhN (UPF0104 family)
MPFSVPKTAVLYRIASAAVSLALVALAARALHKFAAHLSWDEFWRMVTDTPLASLALALIATIVSFSALAAYDVFAVRILGIPGIPVRYAAFAGAAGTAVSNTLGFHVFTGTALRYRIYARLGVGPLDVGKITGVAFMGLGLGYVGTFVLAFWLHAYYAAAIALLAAAGGLLWYLSRAPRTLRVRQWTLALPTARSAAWLMLIGTLEMSAAASALYVLLPANAALDPLTFLLIYTGAIWLGVISHMPGGLGVFEAAMIMALPALDRHGIFAALVLYRGIYNILPFACACLSLNQRGQSRLI